MPRETKAQKTSRIALLLAQYDAQSRELRKLYKAVDTLKEQVREVEPGTYGDWVRGTGTPREIVDQKAVNEDYARRGVPVPKKSTEAPVTVAYVKRGKR